jgi:hypothetical protein
LRLGKEGGISCFLGILSRMLDVPFAIKRMKTSIIYFSLALSQ